MKEEKQRAVLEGQGAGRTKKVLIIGEHSYIGTSFYRYAQKYAPFLAIKMVSARNDAWKREKLWEYDAVVDMAGKAHADIGHVTDQEKEEYYRVNFKLAQTIAQAAKEAGTRQFIYPSSIIIYGESAPVGKRKKITAETIPHPANFYGDSKLQADLAIQKMDDTTFRTAVLRLPMIYGKGSRGNYPLLAGLARKLPVFPAVQNERSMLYIGNLCEFLIELIEQGDGGVFYPQNPEYTKTSEMVRLIAGAAGKKIRITGILTPFVLLAGKMPGKIGRLAAKAFGNCSYEQQLSTYRNNRYQKYSLEQSVKETEGN